MKELKNPFAYDENNNIIYIEKGNELKKEIYKKCHCPVCNEILIPKMGNKNIWHFSHKEDSNCTGGLETGLHLYGKEVIKNHNKIFLPSINLGEATEIKMFDSELVNDIISWVHQNDLECFYIDVFEGNQYDYKWINSEIKINSFIPDSIIEIKGKKLLIEICVTHNVDEEKRKKVETEDLDMLEIYLNPKEIDKKMKDNDFNMDKYILFETERKWIHKTSNIFFERKIRNLIYNDLKPIINEKYTRKEIIERVKNFLVCPKCSGKLIERNKQNGTFYGCSNYPRCDFTKNNLYDVKCPICDKRLYLLKGKAGYFWGHDFTIYGTECQYTRSINKDEKFLIEIYY